MPNLKSQSGIIPLVVLAIVGAVSASGVTVVASQKSIPGDALYPVKQVTENVRVATAFSKTDKAKVHLAIAEEKVKEIEKLEEKGETDEQSSLADKIAEAAQTLEESQSEALELTQSVKSEGEDVGELVELLEVQSNRQQVVITRISPKITVEAGESLRKSLERFREELKVTIEPVEEDSEQEEATQTPCPSPSPSEDENNYQDEEDTSSNEDVDEDFDDYWERKYPAEEDYRDEDVEGVSLSFEDRGFRQLQNSQSRSSDRDPCDSAEGNSGAGSRTFDGGTGSSDIEGGTDAASGDQGESVGAPTTADPGVEGVSTTSLIQLILNALFRPQK